MRYNHTVEIYFGRSSNGRTTDSESVYLGSNPGLPAKIQNSHFRQNSERHEATRLGFPLEFAKGFGNPKKRTGREAGVR